MYNVANAKGEEERVLKGIYRPLIMDTHVRI